MNGATIPFERYPGLPPLFLDFLRGTARELYPDPPTADAAERRGREILGTPSRISARGFRGRRPEANRRAEELASGRAVAAVAGHQVGLFTGPLFTVTKAFDALRLGGELDRRGVPAAGVFWSLTDDHDLEEIARTTRPGPEGPEVLVLEGADRANRRPVGGLPLPERARELLEAFRADARAPDAADTLARFADRWSPGRSYGEAFAESLLDLVEPEPLLIVDPSGEEARRAAVDFFRIAVEREEAVRRALAEGAEAVERAGRTPSVPFRQGVFPFFAIEGGERRRVEDPRATLRRAEAGEAWLSPDVLTRPIFKSFLMPTAASVLGPAEIAYHAQALRLFPVFELPPPVLFPRSHLVVVGPAERRAAQALGVAPDLLLSAPPDVRASEVPGAQEVARLSEEVARRLAAVEPALTAVDPTLAGALENAARKIRHQLEQLAERTAKAAERRDAVARDRRRRLETMLRPNGTTGERVYPPLVPMLAYGWQALEEIRRAASGSLEGARIVELGAASGAGGDADGG